MSNIKVILENKGAVTLSQNNYKTSGGEGSLYRISEYMVKIYTDKDRIKQFNIAEKINKLKNLKYDYIVSPVGLVTQNIDFIGYYMNYVDGIPLSIIFTNEYRNKSGFNDSDASNLVYNMKKTFLYAHNNGAVIVDPNELNWLIINKTDPMIVDVDSWKIDKWPATVIMPSIRDWHAKDFNEFSDWFSWGILTFQIYTGIHPYKGTLDGYLKSDLEKRMKDNASIFSNGIRLNRAVRDFSCIPSMLLDWYEAVFQNGERSIPPSPFDKTLYAPKILLTKRIITKKTGLLIFDKLGSFETDIVKVFPCGVILLKNGKIIDVKTNKELYFTFNRCEVTIVEDGWLITEIGNNNFILTFVSLITNKQERLTLNINFHDIIRYENRMFAITDRELHELKINFIGNRILPSIKKSWNIFFTSTTWYDGFGILDVFGSKFVIAPFGDEYLSQVRVKEIDNVKIICGKSGNKFITMIGLDSNGDYNKIEMTFGNDYKSYKIWIGKTDSPELNIAILPKGVCATITEDGKLAIFVPSNDNVTKIEDKQINTILSLANIDNKVVYIDKNALWHISMK